jgi:predicted enzyme related to lactoylglutathione lyase
MGEVTTYPNGHFCWIDLGTTDVEGAKAFYGGLFGWEFADVPGGDSDVYTMCRIDGKDVAGMHTHSQQEGTDWSSYISVDDVEATVVRARDLGGTVVLEPLDVAQTARMAVIKDPAGAVTCLWQAEGFPGARLVNEVGAWGWNELTTPDMEGATRFYGELFGWEAEDVPVDIPRAALTLGPYLVGGMHAPQPGESDTARWTISFMVEDADRSAARVEELGGRVLLPPMEIPIGKFSIVSDPTGGTFTVSAAPAGAFRGLDGSPMSRPGEA